MSLLKLDLSSIIDLNSKFKDFEKYITLKQLSILKSGKKYPLDVYLNVPESTPDRKKVKGILRRENIFKNCVLNIILSKR